MTDTLYVTIRLTILVTHTHKHTAPKWVIHTDTTLTVYTPVFKIRKVENVFKDRDEAFKVRLLISPDSGEI